MIKTVTSANFDAEVIKNDRPVLVDLWAPWCGPCIAMEPAIKELAGEFEGKVDVAKLNVDENPDIAQHFDVMSIPTLLVFKAGQPVQRIVGLSAKEKLATAMTAALA